MSETESKLWANLSFLERRRRDVFKVFYQGASPQIIRKLGISYCENETVACYAARNLPSPTLNKVVITEKSDPIKNAKILSSINWLRKNCSKNGVISMPSCIVTPQVRLLFEEHGLRESGIIMTMFAGDNSLSSVTPIYNEVIVREVTRNDTKDFSHIVCAAFSQAEGFESWLATLVGQVGVKTYLAYLGSNPIGAGILFNTNNWGWLGFGATLPGYRRRGVQSALLNRRLIDGGIAGVRGFSGEVVHLPRERDGENPSYRNFQRAGLRSVHTWTNFHLQTCELTPL